jgi:chloride channel protein, CIC family
MTVFMQSLFVVHLINPRPAISKVSPVFSGFGITSVRERLHILAEGLRDQLAHTDCLPQLTFLGLLTGVFAGLVIVLFRWVVEIPLGYFLPNSFENFESLGAMSRFLWPFLGACVLGLAMRCIDQQHHAAGIGHVLDRLQNHQGRMPIGNVINQFLGGAMCLLSGQSVGREGPAVHLGAGSGSLLGQWLRLPTNSLRPLAGCGVAAAIAACFNTPLAGVIFAMEVVVLEYTIAGFIPVTLAAVAGATITRFCFGTEIAFINAQTVVGDLRELPLMALVGLATAVFAAAYIRLHCASYRWSAHRSLFLRFAVAGALTGACAIFLPQIMGIGYDTIHLGLNGQLTLGLLLALAVVKLIATAVGLGVGFPGGVVGPLLFIGACVGGAVGSGAQMLMPESASAIGFYVILGMGAMMGATLNAPLAAMMATLELTYNPNIIFPSMLVVVAACLTTRWLFNCEGLFQNLLRVQGKSRSEEALEQLLSRTGVRKLMDRHWVSTDNVINVTQARELLSHHPHWILIANGQELLTPADLHSHLTGIVESDEDIPLDEDTTWISLPDIPARRYPIEKITADANLFEALSRMNQAHIDALWVESLTDPEKPLGVIRREFIENFYRS